MTEIADIRDGIVTNLQTITGVNAYPYRLENPQPAILMVVGMESADRTAFQRGAFSLTFTVIGMVGNLVDEGAQRQLDLWLSPTGAQSVWAALESDRTLGGTVDALAVTRHEGAQVMTLDSGTEVLGSTWHVQVEL